MNIKLTWPYTLVCFIIIFTIFAGNSFSNSEYTFSALERKLGVTAIEYIANISLSDIEEGSVIVAKVVDPSKLGGCKIGDHIKLEKVGNNTWLVEHILTGSIIELETHIEPENIVVHKIVSIPGTNNTQD